MASYSTADMVAELVRDEGERLKPYIDTVGKVTIGVGHNLTDKGITQAQSRILLLGDMDDAEAALDKHAGWWRCMSPARQRGLLNMCFNMGWGDGTNGLSSFKHSLALLEAGDYVNAATNILKSKWAKQVGARANRIADQFLKG